MKTFTPTQLKNNASDVFNEVQRSGCVKIVSKSRPDMLILTQEALDELIGVADGWGGETKKGG